MWPHGLQPARLLCPWDSLGKSTEVDCNAILQGIFPTQGSNRSPALQADPLPLSHEGSPRSECDSSNVKHTNLTSWNSMCFLLQNPRPARVGNRNAYTSLDSVLPAHLQGWRLCRARWLKDNSFKHILSRILLKTLHYVLTKNQGAPRPWSCPLRVLGAFPPRHHPPAAPGNLKNLTCLSSSPSLAYQNLYAKPFQLSRITVQYTVQQCAPSCPILQPMDCSPPGSSVHGIFQARILEWVAISSSRGSSQSRDYINNLRYADDTTLMAESEEELKSPLMKVKEESGKSRLKTQHPQN